MSRQDTVIRKMNWRSHIYLCLFASSAESRARQIMDDPLLSKPSWNGDKWLGVGAKRNRTVLEKHFDREGFCCIEFYNWHHRRVSRRNLLALYQSMEAFRGRRYLENANSYHSVVTLGGLGPWEHRSSMWGPGSGCWV